MTESKKCSFETDYFAINQLFAAVNKTYEVHCYLITSPRIEEIARKHKIKIVAVIDDIMFICGPAECKQTLEFYYGTLIEEIPFPAEVRGYLNPAHHSFNEKIKVFKDDAKKELITKCEILIKGR